MSKSNEDLEPADADVERFEAEIDRRHWIGDIMPILQNRSHDPDPSGRVQLALDLLHIEACERLRRILRSDLREISE